MNDNFDDYVSKYFGFWQRLVPAEALPKLMAPVWGEARQRFAARNIQRRVQGTRLAAHKA